MRKEESLRFSYTKNVRRVLDFKGYTVGGAAAGSSATALIAFPH